MTHKIHEYLIDGVDDEDLLLETFLEEHGLTEDLILQCRATQQTMKICPRQMYEVLSSQSHVSLTQRSLAEAQTSSQWVSALNTPSPGNTAPRNGAPDGSLLERNAQHTWQQQCQPHCRPSQQSLGGFHGVHPESVPPFQQPLQGSRRGTLPQSRFNEVAGPGSPMYQEIVPSQQEARQMKQGAPQTPGVSTSHMSDSNKRHQPPHIQQPPAKSKKRSLSDGDKEKLRAAQDDGYRWRKYGEKTLYSKTGEVTVKSYFRCCHPVCKMRKQVINSFKDSCIHLVGDGHNHEVL